MRRNAACRRRPRSTALVLLALALLPLGGCRKAPASPPWSWQDGGLDRILAAARAQNAAALVEIYATWCPTCHQLEHDVFDHSAHRLPADRIVGGRIDFDTPEGQAVATRYRVMGLPTSLVLDAAGSELGRVEGYETVDGYVAALDKALAGKDESTEVLEKFAKAPDDPQLTAEAGSVRLARGEEAEGLRLLERARELDPDNAQKAYAAATRTLGRWFYRVQHQYDRALAYFQDGAAKTAGTDAAWGFHYWTAMTLRQLDRSQDAQTLLDGLVVAQPGIAEPLALKAEVLYMVGEDADAALALAREAARIKPTDDWNHYLVAVLAERLGDRPLAVESARRAVQLAPDEAMYEHLLERLQQPAP